MEARRLLVPIAAAALLATGAVKAETAAHASAATSDPVLHAIGVAARRGALTREAATGYRHTYTAAVAEVARLHGVRSRELRAAVAIVHGIASRGSLLPSRMPLVFLTLRRNLEWWGAQGPPPPGSPGEPTAKGRVCKPLASQDAHAANLTFPGSGIVFEYYPGMGLQLQVNATFGEVNAWLTQGSAGSLAQAGATLDEMLKLASYRQGHLTWEYEFPFEGAQPPWTSGLSQATAVEALTRAATKLGRPDYLADAVRLTGLFASAPPTGVLTHLRGGDWFLLYSFSPGQIVLNADLDAVTALHDLGAATHKRHVRALAHSGLHALEVNITRFNTGRWSFYSLNGPLADLNYHALNMELAEKLCERTGVSAVCRAARSFKRELNARCPVVSHGAGESDDLQTEDSTLG